MGSCFGSFLSLPSPSFLPSFLSLLANLLAQARATKHHEKRAQCGAGMRTFAMTLESARHHTLNTSSLYCFLSACMRQYTAIGCLSGMNECLLQQPLVYWKNMRQQNIPLTNIFRNPLRMYSGVTISVCSIAPVTGACAHPSRV